ncbi:MAG: DUF3048 domain-containing protein [Acutalibacteraceae bacterium]|nr:DUF3048 domain-containing protein [Clostridia bacterium]MEE0809220.1 DUF3048 domain-containing protein [Acutalibacteraceae bacterium]
MLKKIIAITLCLAFVCFVGCKKTDNTSSTVESVPEVIVEEEKFAINPLTGVENLDPAALNNRPVAVMVNNVKVAQAVQTGPAYADIVYETEVEGGITRLMAVFKDVTKVQQIGSIRSARYPYVDLAMGHNAVYIHSGSDPTYCAPHLKDLDHVSVDNGICGAKRVPNGLSREHTVYAYGNTLWEGIKGAFKNTTVTDNTPFATFTAEGESLSLTGGAATSIDVPFPASKTGFTYSENTGLYTRISNGKVVNDYITSATTEVKNVFVLLTSITDYPDGKHRRVDLTSGDGYYATNGTYTFIKWNKGKDSDSFKFTDSDGNPLKVSAGNSWVCIANKFTCNPTFQ